MDNKIECDFCKKMKDRETEMFPLILILPIFDENNRGSIESKTVCNECFYDLANDFKKIIKNRSK